MSAETYRRGDDVSFLVNHHHRCRALVALFAAVILPAIWHDLADEPAKTAVVVTSGVVPIVAETVGQQQIFAW